VPPTQPEQTSNVAVKAEVTRLTLSPGEAGTIEAVVRHAGSEVEEFSVRLGGPAAAFGTVLTGSIRLYPGTDATVAVRFAPLKSPAPPAGDHGYVLEIASFLHPDVARRVTGAVTVRPVVDAAMDVQPEETRGRRTSFTHTVTLQNLGNTPVQAPVLARQPGDVLRLTVDPPWVGAAPGSHGVAVLRGSAPRRWIGSSEFYTFDVSTTLPDTTVSLTRPLRRMQKPVFPAGFRSRCSRSSPPSWCC
jgi:hypothetical protein